MSKSISKKFFRTLSGNREQTAGDPEGVRKILQEATGRVAYDVGANIGRVSEILSKNFNEVFAFEPALESFEVLKKNQNPKIHPFNIALSDKDGFIQLDARKEHIAKGQLVDPEMKTFDWGVTIETRLVPAFTLDTIIQTLPHPDFIKIDTEGYESKILKASRKLVKETNARIFVEIHGEQYGKEISSLLEATHDIEVIRHPGHSKDSYSWINHYFLFARPKAQSKEVN